MLIAINEHCIGNTVEILYFLHTFKSPDLLHPTTPSLNIRSLDGHTFVSHIQMGFEKGVPELFLNVAFGHSDRS